LLRTNVFPTPKGGDFPYRVATLHPSNFDIRSAVDITIMQRHALTTSPLLTKKRTEPFRAGCKNPPANPFGNSTTWERRALRRLGLDLQDSTLRSIFGLTSAT
jgi:hypothetical protein